MSTIVNIPIFTDQHLHILSFQLKMTWYYHDFSVKILMEWEMPGWKFGGGAVKRPHSFLQLAPEGFRNRSLFTWTLFRLRSLSTLESYFWGEETNWLQRNGSFYFSSELLNLTDRSTMLLEWYLHQAIVLKTQEVHFCKTFKRFISRSNQVYKLSCNTSFMAETNFTL